jgi:CheY-like chemotaxis protein
MDLHPDTILVVDDEMHVRALVQKILHDEGYRVVLAGDGAEAKEMIEGMKEQISAIVLDWAMPRMSGIELLRWLKSKSDYAHLPVVMQTAMDHPDHIREGIEAGAFYYLTKPIQRPLLTSIVRAAVTDFHYKQGLLRKLRESERAFRLIEEGVFRFRTIAEGETLAIRIANASSRPEEAMTVSEIFTNAVEHGNLGITYEDKSRLLEEGSWEREVARRLELPEHRDKYVEVRIHRNDEGMLVEVEDQGSGFDFTKYLTFDEERVFHTHGRGIAMATQALKVEFLGKGNKVRVTIAA